MDSIHQIKVCIVIPCFNEENNLLKTLETLGFDPLYPETDNDTHLIIVDNNSTDGTWRIASNIQDYFPKNVHVIKETVQGYIPPRHTGNLYAQSLAYRNGWPLANVLIVQADADTFYSKGYISAMRRATRFFGSNTLLEAYNKISHSFEMQYTNYISISHHYDAALSSLLVKNKTYDVVVDDKQCAYRLTDYFNWGMHEREFLTNGDELFAETTRLFIKARVKEARKVLLNSVYTEHSARKLIEQPLLQYVTAGFPRERHWTQKWNSQKMTISQFMDLQNHHTELWAEAIQTRIAHLIGMFSILPLFINETLCVGMTKQQPNLLYDSISHFLPPTDRETLVSTPGHVILEIFNILEQHPNLWKPIVNKLADIHLY